MPPWRVGALARRLGAVVDGDPELELDEVAALGSAGPRELSFLANRRYAPALARTRAGAVLVRTDEPRLPGGPTYLRVDDPYLGFARAMALMHPPLWPAPGVDPRAWVAEDAEVTGAHIAAFAWIGPGARVGRGSWVEPGAVVGAGARVGEGCRLMAHSVVAEGCALGDRVWLNPGAVVGGEGFGFAPSPEGLVKIPQLGVAIVEDDVEIGALSAVDRAALPGQATRVRRGAKLDNFVQVGHGAEVGPGALMVAYAGVAGSARLGAGVQLAAKAAVLGHVAVGDGAKVGVASVVHGPVEAGAEVSGVPAIPHRDWLRAATAARELPAALKELRRLQARVEALERALGARPEGDGPPRAD
jgi:UDP-3-O-[3-hydroxymyristoyl] glucosamine N-acyltransferase